MNSFDWSMFKPKYKNISSMPLILIIIMLVTSAYPIGYFLINNLNILNNLSSQNIELFMHACRYLIGTGAVVASILLWASIESVFKEL